MKQAAKSEHMNPPRRQHTEIMSSRENHWERMLKALKGSDLKFLCVQPASHNGRPGPTVQTRHGRIDSVFIEKLGNELFELFTRAIC